MKTQDVAAETSGKDAGSPADGPEAPPPGQTTKPDAVPAVTRAMRLHRLAKGTLQAASLRAVQLVSGKTEKLAIFNPDLVDRLKAPLTWYNE